MSNNESFSMQALMESSILDGENQSYLEMQYESYIQDANSVSHEWRNYFSQFITSDYKTNEPIHSAIRQQFITHARQSTLGQINPDVQNGAASLAHERKQMNVHDLINGYRLLGHLYSQTDPLGVKQHAKVPELELEGYGLSAADFATNFDCGSLYGTKVRPLQEILAELKRIYCGSVAVEYMHIPNSEELAWIQHKIESTLYNFKLNKATQSQILREIIAAEGLEKYLAAKYPGAKRFGLEGSDSLIVALDTLIQRAGENGVQEIVLGMAHRGRLNVLVNVLGKTPRELFDEFEGKHHKSISKAVSSGDVKYHQGFASDIQVAGGKLHLSLAFNPSHLEVVSAVVCGSVCARQQRREHDGKKLVLPVAIHGDAAFSGQGIVMEILNMSQTRGYSIGGTVHIIINNQIGFTTSNAHDMRSTLYCSDIGKMISVPILHVNANDPEAVYAVTEIALAYRNKFFKDVIIDLIGYRRHGHNEADEPAATQPGMYKIIRNLPTVTKIYADKLIATGNFTQAEIDGLIDNYRKLLDARDKAVTMHAMHDGKSAYATDWSAYHGKDWREPTDTRLPVAKLQALANNRDAVPADFKLHPLIQKIVDNRKKMTTGELPVDWGYAETLAYASLLADGYMIRLSGQDCSRGTFFHRHVIWHDQHKNKTYVSLNNLTAKQGKFWVIDSLLSEAAVLGFEYGYASSEPKALVIWEAQFGDFANNAQVVIDQFISSGEQKWGRFSGLVMFLPHGYEGQGPEHSSARLERFLQLCAQKNLQVCVPTTPAQVYHMLRRQMLRPMRKPLIVMTPKSLLRHKNAVSTLAELADGKFYPLLVDNKRNINLSAVKRVILCSGKVFYELEEARQQQKRNDVAIIRIEQLYPFPERELKEELKAYPKATTVVWCQEEPKNQGAWYASQHHFIRCLARGQKLEYVGRDPSAAPAVGYVYLHNEQQQQLVADALNG